MSTAKKEYKRIMGLESDTLIFGLENDEEFSNNHNNMPEMIESYGPDYPKHAKENNIQGTVWIRSLVDPNGDVLKAEIAKTSGHKELDEAALTVALKNRFKPAVINNKRVSAWVTYKVNFNLE